MEIEQIPKQVWIDTINGEINCEYEFLALKIFLTRLRHYVRSDSSPAAYDKYAGELKSFFIKYQNILTAQNDLQKIIDKGGI